ncbi:HNH endonuclease [Bacillus wiedmannii]|uniref:HNH endonuclease n=1 Tax=Bacillus wiedmannii TaxID=1890302 RepID=UPI0007CB0726|nr:HNH endonuclease [Bacillus wiedmannii]OAK35888.1 hypothetical protein A6284_26535 [Bacillus wiedmannii]HDR7640777.1 HNH endonuclease [Bacillus wiedmannii]
MIIKDIEGYEGLYEITEDGRIFIKERVIKITEKNRRIFNRKIKRKELKQRVVKGLCQVHLSKNGKHKGFKVHRLVAQMFIPNIENKQHVKHINGIKTDNRVSNLEWKSHRVGKRGTEHVLSKLSDNDVRQIKKMSANGITKMQISKEFNVSWTLISDVVSGKRWNHVE